MGGFKEIRQDYGGVLLGNQGVEQDLEDHDRNRQHRPAFPVGFAVAGHCPPQRRVLQDGTKQAGFFGVGLDGGFEPGHFVLDALQAKRHCAPAFGFQGFFRGRHAPPYHRSGQGARGGLQGRMVRHTWTPRMLARRLGRGGWFQRPTLVFRLRADKLPSRLPRVNGCYRPHDLEGRWPPEWRALFDTLEGWKYVNLWPEGRYLVVELIGYGSSARPLLPPVVAAIATLQGWGLRVDVR